MTASEPRDADASDDVRVETHADHAILHPPHTVKERAYVPARKGDPTLAELFAAAEANLQELAGEFQEWVDLETDKLADARDRCRAAASTPAAVRELFQAAHTLRGDAAVFGFPLAGRVADSLAKLLDGCPHEFLPDMIVDQHVDAIRAIVREGARGADNPQARELAQGLIDLASRFMQGTPISASRIGARAA